MPGDPQECRQHALKCLELAKTASAPMKARFLEMAQTWTKLANDLEGMQRLLIQIEGEPKDGG
jgi:hypothetical protein